MLDEISLDDESLDVQVATYRSFVNEHPNQTNYFQPILDRLQVVPSRFDTSIPSVVVEGKSDYYILRYCAELFSFEDLPLIPTFGASTMDSMLAMCVAWNLSFIFLLDGDMAGQDAKASYSKDYILPNDRLLTLSELVPEMEQIEDILDDQAKSVISSHFEIEAPPSKSQVKRYFQEKLASNDLKSLSPEFEKRARSLCTHLKNRLPK